MFAEVGSWNYTRTRMQLLYMKRLFYLLYCLRTAVLYFSLFHVCMQTQKCPSVAPEHGPSPRQETTDPRPHPASAFAGLSTAFAGWARVTVVLCAVRVRGHERTGSSSARCQLKVYIYVTVMVHSTANNLCFDGVCKHTLSMNGAQAFERHGMPRGIFLCVVPCVFL